MRDLSCGWVLNRKTIFAVLAALGLMSCSSTPGQPQADRPPAVKVEKPFAGGGVIEMHLDGGDYEIRPASDEHVRVSFAGNTGNAVAELDAEGTHANLTVRDTPHNNFRAIVEVPAAADLTIHLAAGNLHLAAIAGNKDIDSTAGNVDISVPNPDDYASVDASVKVGDLNGGPFGKSGTGLAPRLSWSGPGKHTLHASLGAGNLEFTK